MPVTSFTGTGMAPSSSAAASMAALAAAAASGDASDDSGAAANNGTPPAPHGLDSNNPAELAAAGGASRAAAAAAARRVATAAGASGSSGPVAAAAAVARSRGAAVSATSGGGGVVPSCQVERCNADMGVEKRYNRRHKVCDAHRKASVVLLAGLRQRFCQQCSRFHELSHFDDTKKSCRLRLAGHNERRRRNPADAHDQNGGRGNPAGNHFQIR